MFHIRGDVLNDIKRSVVASRSVCWWMSGVANNGRTIKDDNVHLRSL